jgi:hypothetical protein
MMMVPGIGLTRFIIVSADYALRRLNSLRILRSGLISMR